MKILITGGGGFIGKPLIEAMAGTDNKVLVLEYKPNDLESKHSNINWIFEDIANIETYRDRIIEFNPDVVIHMAWEGIPDFSEEMSKRNLINSTNFLDLIIDNTDCKKIIISGSCFEYGKVHGAVKETHELNINSFFSWAKQSLYKYLDFKCGKNDVDLIWFRFFYVYGPGQRKASLIPLIVNSFVQNTMLDIRNPYNKNDFIYVQDIADALKEAALNENRIDSGIYNLGSGYSTSVYEISQIVEQKMTGSDKFSRDLITKIKKEEYSDFWADLSNTKSSFNWTPKFSIKQGIEEMIKYYSN